MDQFTSALGGLVRIDPDKSDPVQRLSVMLGRFVLGHSREPKDTQAMLARVQSAARRGALWLENQMGEFSWRTTTIDQVEGFLGKADGQDQDLRVTLGALRNRDILEEGHQLLTSREVDHTRLGALLTEHHRVLRDSLEISTPKIERMLDAALGAGALGGKINGSGGGGCMFVYAPNAPEEVAKAIRAAGGDAWIIEVATGVEVVISRQPDVDVSDPIAHHGLG